MSATYNNSMNKKAKTEDWQEEFESVRQYILRAPFSSDHPAVAAALNGLDQETKRRLRDSKLQQKFASTAAAAVDYEAGADAVKVEKPSAEKRSPGVANRGEEAMATDDWHDIASDGHVAAKQQSDEDMSSYLGLTLAKEAVASLAQNNVRCASPLAAVAAVLHAALLNVGFSCTGLPDNGSSGGFAAPTRALPASQFLPPNWEKDPTIKLRYRKEGAGATVLTVAPGTTDSGEQQIEVKLAPSNSSEPCRDPLQFALNDYINMESWEKACKDNAAVLPALHYKSLSALLTDFAQQFDLGPINDSAMKESSQAPYVDYTMLSRPNAPNTGTYADFGIPSPDLVTGGRTAVPPTRPGGDFGGDLIPTGIDPTGIPSPGNLMGPNHPMLGGVPGSRFGRPRFDPFGPPGHPGEPSPTEPQDPDNLLNQQGPETNRRVPPGGTGNPNKDQLRPPSLGNNNMFM